MKSSTQRRTLLILMVLGGIYFLAFCPINIQGAHDQNMLSVFSPDEFAQYPHILQMLDQPADSFLQSVYRFIQYKHYYYGYPFYLYSAFFSLIPLKLLGLNSIPADLLMLRQMVSVLPMLASVGLLVYMQTRFENPVRSVFLFLFLLAVPMVIVNNLWWHPESLVLLFIVLTLFFLQKDELAFGCNFYFAAIACGLAVATKLIGLFFFLVIPAYIFLGWYQGKINPRQSLQFAVKFVLLMVITFVVSNPFLVFKSERDAAINAQLGQADVTSSGFVFDSGKDPSLWNPVINEYYAQFAFLGLACLALLLGIVNREKRLVNLLLLLWCLPFSIYLLYFVSLRHRYYFMPVLLPLFSTVPNVFDWVLPQKIKIERSTLLKWFGSLVVVVIIGSQLVYNFNYDRRVYVGSLHKEANSQALKFFSTVEKNYLSRIVLNRQLVIYRSVRVYVADEPRWTVKYRWFPASYSYIEKSRADVLMLWKQELYDYTNSDVLGNAVNPESFAESLSFYQDARQGSLAGYTLLYQNDFGVLYVSNELANVYFK